MSNYTINTKMILRASLVCTLLLANVASANLIYDFQLSGCSFVSNPDNSCANVSGRWTLSDSALDDGVATGASEILGFHFRAETLYWTTDFNLTHLNGVSLEDISLHGNDLALTQFDNMGSQSTFVVQLSSRVEDDLAFTTQGNASIFWNNGSSFDFDILDAEGQWLRVTSEVPLPLPIWLLISGMISLAVTSARSKAGCRKALC